MNIEEILRNAPARDTTASIEDIVERREEIERPLDRTSYSRLLNLARESGNRLVLSCGGGSLPGMCGNIALMRILEELDLRPHVTEIWGTSAGAIVGGGWATGTEAFRIMEITKSIGRGWKDVCWALFARSLVSRFFGRSLPDGLMYGRRIARAIDSGLGVKKIEDCEIPFRCVACRDDGSFGIKVFRSGLLLSAIFASMSLPGIIVPVDPRTGEPSKYYDGGLVEKTPLISPIAEHNRSGDSRRLLLLATHFGIDAQHRQARGFHIRFIQTMYALEDQLWRFQLKDARNRKNVTVLLLNPHLRDPSFFDFSMIEGNYLTARLTFREALSDANVAGLIARD